LEPVGWFVAHSRSALEMSDREVLWFDRFFPEPGKVAVLAKPERFQATRFSFVVRGQDGQLQRAAAAHAIILPLTGRARAPQDAQIEDGLIPSVPAPTAPPSARPAAPPQSTVAAQPVEPAAPAKPPEPAPSPVFPPPVEPPPPVVSAPTPERIAFAPEPPPQPAAPPQQPAVPPPVVPQTPPPVAHQSPPPAAKPPDTPSRIVPPPPPRASPPVRPHGLETRPLTPPPATSVPPKTPEREQPSPKWPVVPKAPVPPPVTSPSISPPGGQPAHAAMDETVEMPRIPVPIAPEVKPATQADQVWRQRVEALPLRPAPPSISPKSHPIAHEPGTTTRGLDTARSARPRLAFMFLLAALLGCSVGYYAYLQLPPPVIPLSVRPQGDSLVVSWPAAQTAHVNEATLQVGPSQPVLLSPAERSAGQMAVAAHGNDVKIELVAHHWPRDSRGIVRFVRPATAQ
jgi:hypothetical protein